MPGPTFPKVDSKSNSVRIEAARKGLQGFILDATGLQRLKPPSIQELVTENVDERIGTSYLGTPIFSNIEFPPAIFTDLDGVETIFEGIVIDTVLMNVNQTKIIPKTQIAGKPGTVKEFISDGDFDISITGALITETTLLNSFKNRYPREQIKTLFDLLKAQESVKVRAEFLQQFEINSVVVEKYAFPQTKGNRDKQLFTIKMVSDIELLLEEVETQV